MATRISIDVAEARDAASTLRSKSQESINLKNHMESSARAIQSHWEGVAYQRFAQDFESLKKQMQDYAILLNSIAEDLDMAASIIQKADKSLANRR